MFLITLTPSMASWYEYSNEIKRDQTTLTFYSETQPLYDIATRKRGQ